jgi:hypothetical protein
MREIKEAHRILISEKDQKISTLEMRLKGVQEQYEFASRDKTSNQARADRRISDLELKE